MFLYVLGLIVILAGLALGWLDLRCRRRQQGNRVQVADSEPITIPTLGDPIIGTLKGIYEMLVRLRAPGGIDFFTRRCQGTGVARQLKLSQGYLFASRCVNVMDPELARMILFADDTEMAKIQISDDPDNVSTLVVQDSILMAKGDTWKMHKRALSPSFAYQHIQSILPEFLGIAEQLKSRWCTLDKGVEIYEIIRRASLDAIGRGGFGYDFHQLDDSNNDGQGLHQLYENFMKELRKPIHFFTRLDKLMGTRKAMLERYEGFENYIANIMNDRRATIAQSDSWQPTNILDHLLAAGSNETLTDRQIAHNMNTFFIAGHETVAGVLHSAIQFLSRNQEAQSKAREEINTVTGGGEITYDAIKEMRYLDCCVSETLRLLPAGPLIGRRAAMEQDVGPLHIAEKDLVMVNIYAIQRDPDYWGGEADQFQPERFLPENRLSSSRKAFMPFSMGPRQCIGNNFALLEMRSFLAVLLREFEFLPDPATADVPFLAITIPSFTMNPACHLLIKPVKA